MITDADIIKLSKVFLTKRDFDLRMNGLESRMGKLESRMDSLESQMSQIESKMDQVYGELRIVRQEQVGHYQSHRDNDDRWERLREAILVSDIKK